MDFIIGGTIVNIIEQKLPAVNKLEKKNITRGHACGGRSDSSAIFDTNLFCQMRL